MSSAASNDDIVMLPDLIDQLSEAPVPPAIPWVPQTWGWSLLAVVIVALLALWGIRRYLRWRADAYRRAALIELDQRLDDEGAIALAEILRRTALSAYPRERVAGLTGQRWWRFLDASLGDRRTPHFDGPLGQELSTAPYRATTTDGTTPPSAELVALSRRWIRHHRRDIPQESAS